jgi:hypothetical protein
MVPVIGRLRASISACRKRCCRRAGPDAHQLLARRTRRARHAAGVSAVFDGVSLGAAASKAAARIYLNTAIPGRPRARSSRSSRGIRAGSTTRRTTGRGLSTTAAVGPLDERSLLPVQDRDLVAAFDSTSARMKSTNGSSWTPSASCGRCRRRPRRSRAKRAGVSVPANSKSTSRTRTAISAWSRTARRRRRRSRSASTGAIEGQFANSTQPHVDAIKSSTRATRRKGKPSGARSRVRDAGRGAFHLHDHELGVDDADPEPTDHDNARGPQFRRRLEEPLVGARCDAHEPAALHAALSGAVVAGAVLHRHPVRSRRRIQALMPLGDTLMVFGATKIFLDHRADLAGLRSPADARESGRRARAAGGLRDRERRGSRRRRGRLDLRRRLGSLAQFTTSPAWQDLVQNAAPMRSRGRLRVSPDAQRTPRRRAAALSLGRPGEWILDLSARNGKDRVDGDRSRHRGYIPFDGPEVTGGNRNRLLSWDSTRGS